MQAGKLHSRINLQRSVETVTSTGAVQRIWTTICTLRAEVVQRTATEFLAGYGEAENGTIIFRIRYRPGITTADRIRYAGQFYDLEEIKEIGRQRGLELRGVSTA